MKTPTTNATAAEVFTGWVRQQERGPWTRLCRGGTYDECFVELLRLAPPGTDKFVRRGTADPNADRKVR